MTTPVPHPVPLCVRPSLESHCDNSNPQTFDAARRPHDSCNFRNKRTVKLGAHIGQFPAIMGNARVAGNCDNLGCDSHTPREPLRVAMVQVSHAYETKSLQELHIAHALASCRDLPELLSVVSEQVPIHAPSSF